MSAPKKTRPGDREPVSYFEMERRRRQLDEPAENEPGDVPALPETSPWHSDPVGKEPTVDRSCDGDVTGYAVDHHDGDE
jgi:hypothetical protein